MVQPEQYKGQLDIDKVIIHEGALIGKDAFEGCTGIAEVNIAENMAMSDGAFWNCTGITQLNIADGVSIGKRAFKQHSSQRGQGSSYHPNMLSQDLNQTHAANLF